MGPGVEAFKKETNTQASSSLKKDTQQAQASSSTSLKKEKKEKPCVVLDWHNTLEKGNKMPPASLQALEQLLMHVDVHIISWVGSEDRFEKTMDQIPQLGQTLRKVKSYRCTCASWGGGSKVDWACHLGALCIMDDNEYVIQEAKEWNLKAYQIGRGGYWQLADAVVQFMQDLPGLQPWTGEEE